MPKTIFEENNEGVFADDIGVAQVDDFIEEAEEEEEGEEEAGEEEEEEEEEVVFDILLTEIRALGEELEAVNSNIGDVVQLLGELRDFAKTLLMLAKPAAEKPKARPSRPVKKKAPPKAKPRAVVSRSAKKKVLPRTKGKPGRPGKEPPKISVRRTSR
jgi:hypothetical protein